MNGVTVSDAPSEMDRQHRFESIDPADLGKLLLLYNAFLPSKLKELDLSRYQTVPKTLVERRTAKDAYLTKDELVALVDWKLSHGTFRPSLKGLVNQNSDDTVKTATRDAFSALDALSIDSVKGSLNTLTKLKGIGPATASLILSVYEPDRVPFFSDELFRWVFWEEGKGKGWDRPIKYTLKEYLAMLEKVQGRVNELDGALKAVDLEKMAWVLARETHSREGKVQQMAKGQVLNDGTEIVVTDEGKVKRKVVDEEKWDKPAKKSKETPKEKSRGRKEAQTAKVQTGTRSSARLKGS